MPKREKKAHLSIKHEVVQPGDYLHYNFPISCEDCSHFDPEAIKCTLGYNPEPHLKKTQQRSYEVTGTLAFCRFIEID